MHNSAPPLDAAPVPSKKRGIIWLLCSGLLLGVTGFTLVIMAIVFTAKALFTLASLFTVNAFKGDDMALTELYFYGMAAACLLAYLGVCYGIALIVAAYQKYNFNRARWIALEAWGLSLFLFWFIPVLLR